MHLVPHARILLIKLLPTLTATGVSTALTVYNTNVGKLGITSIGWGQKLANETFNNGVNQPGCEDASQSARRDPYQGPVWALNDPTLLSLGITQQDVCSHRRSYLYAMEIFPYLPIVSKNYTTGAIYPFKPI